MASPLLDELQRTWREQGAVAVLRRVAGRARHAVMVGLGPLRRTVAEFQRNRAAGGLGLAVSMAGRRLRFAFLSAIGRGQSEAELIRHSMEYWNQGDKIGVDLKDYSHWEGAGPWQDRQRWLRLGQVHFHMFERLVKAAGAQQPVRRVVEWGCGGGANAIHFVGSIDRFCGVEIAQPSLDECARVLTAAGFGGFEPVLVAADAPEAALAATGGGFDFYLSTYVFELLPGKAYGERILRLAHDLLRPGGMALIQIRYDDGSERSSQKSLDYFRNSTRFTSYRVEEFWNLARQAGFEPDSVVLVPEKTEDFSGDRYAYFSLVRPDRARP